MNLNEINNSTWIAVIDGSKPVNFQFLGLQLAITNLRQRLRAREISMSVAVSELKNFMLKYRGLPAAQHDFQKIAH